MAMVFKRAFALFFLFAALSLSQQAWAAACVTCTFTKIADETYPTVTSQATLTGTNHYVEMGTDSTISYDASLTGLATGTASKFQLAGGFTVGDKIQIDCDATETVKNVGGSGAGALTLPITKVYIDQTSAIGPPGSGTLCNGIGGGASLILTYSAIAANNVVYMDTQINATHVMIGGTYSTANNGSALNLQAKCTTSGANKCAKSVTLTANNNVLISFLSSVGFTSTIDLAFGAAVYSALPTTSSDFVKLGTNGAATYGGVFSAAPTTGTITAGSATMNNVQNGVTIQVQCDATAVMAKSGASGSKITVNGIEVRVQGSTGAYGTGSVCNGSGGAVATTMVYNAATANTFYFGGKIDGSTATSFANGDYSSNNSGGTNFNVVVLNQ